MLHRTPYRLKAYEQGIRYLPQAIFSLQDNNPIGLNNIVARCLLTLYLLFYHERRARYVVAQNGRLYLVPLWVYTKGY